MFNRRLINIVSQDSSSSRTNVNPQRRPRQRTPEWLKWQWERLFGRIQVLLRFTRAAIGLRSMIGPENFKKVLEDEDLQRMASREVERQQIRAVRSAQIRNHRFIFGEMIAPYMGEPTATAHPETCEHPNEALRLQGNKYQKAVYCLLCHVR